MSNCSYCEYFLFFLNIIKKRVDIFIFSYYNKFRSYIAGWSSWQLVGLITRRSEVRVLPPQPVIAKIYSLLFFIVFILPVLNTKKVYVILILEYKKKEKYGCFFNNHINKKMKNNKKLYVACICFIILTISLLLPRTMQNDTFFTIATGNHILENGYDNLDHLSWHENLNFYKLRWAFDVTIALIYNTFNFTGIYVFVLIIACLTGISLFNILLKQNCKILVAFFVTMFSMISVIGIWGFTARAQIISYLLLLLEVCCIEKLIEKGKPSYYICLFIISVLLVNFHASVWMMTLILIAPYFLEAFVSKFSKNNANSRIIIQTINIKTLLISTFVLFLGSLFSPIGTYVYTYMFKVVGGLSSKFILELQMVNIFTESGISSLLILFIIIFLETKTKIRLSNLAMFLGLFIMGVLAFRNLAFLYIIGSLIIGKYITSFFETYDKDNTLDDCTKYVSQNKVLVIIAVFITVLCISQHSLQTNYEYIDETTYPVSAVNYIKKHIDYESLKVFNHFDFGSYMELNGIKTFIDSRSEIYCKEFNNTEVLQDWYETVCTTTKHYRELFLKYNIDYAVLYNTEIINIYIAQDSNYIKIYEDEYFSIYMTKELYEQKYSNIPLIIYN